MHELKINHNRKRSSIDHRSFMKLESPTKINRNNINQSLHQKVI